MIASLPYYKLGDIADIIGGGTPSKNIKEYYNGSILWASVRDMKNEILDDTEFKITEKALAQSSSKIIPKDNIIIATRVGLGKVCMLSQDTAINQDLKGIIPKNNQAISKYLFYWFKSISKILEENGTGATVKGVKVEFIANLPIPLPPFEEQRRIVGKLDGLFAKIDKSVALLDVNIASANALMPSALNEVFEELGEKWEIKSLSKVVKINSGIALPSIFKDKEHFNGGEIPFYKVAQMNNHHSLMTTAELYFSEEIAKKENIKIFPKGSILIPKRGGAILTNKKRMMIADASYDSNIMGLKAINEVISDEFLFSFLQSIDLSNFVDTTTIPQINNKHIDMMKIPLPPPDIQTQTVAYLDALHVKVEALKKVQATKKAKLLALKASLLESAFKGEL